MELERGRLCATPLVGGLPRSNGQTTAWPSAPALRIEEKLARARVRVTKQVNAPDAVLARPLSLASYPVATGGGEPSALAAKAATATIPIVAIFTTDPIKLGIVASLGRPEGNITGISVLNATLEAKRLGLLRDLLPQATKLAVLVNPAFPAAAGQLENLQQAARAANLRLQVLNASTDAEIDSIFETIARDGLQGVVVATDSFFVTRRARLGGLVTRYKVPAMFSLRAYVVEGGLVSYGVDLPDLYRQAGVYAGRILNGSKPADLPIIQPTKFELVVNQKAAKLLGLSLSPDLLSIADEVIE
jgi:putative tryptophan/tyrosine transport system substrate-binding protein